MTKTFFLNQTHFWYGVKKFNGFGDGSRFLVLTLIILNQHLPQNE
jgi:hypothetical protein